jgi:DeoR/GlpR family transcriptional regulator of sugar metabolism
MSSIIRQTACRFMHDGDFVCYNGPRLMAEAHTNLFKEERQTRILQILELEDRVEVPVLSRRFKVSEDTIRRDLRDLDARGLIRKTHGGAMRHLTPPMPYENRLLQASEVKAAIGRAAADLVQEGDSLIIDSGTTALSLAQSLKAGKLRVLTNSLDVAKAVADRADVDLIVLGGRWDPLHQLIGPATVEQLSRYRVDKVFLGMAGLDSRHGLTAPSEEEAAVKRAMIQVAQQVIGLADRSKLGKVAFAWVAPASAIDILVTDDQADCGPFVGLGWQVIQAPIAQAASF